MRRLAICLSLLIVVACKDNTEKEVTPPKACFAFPAELIHGAEGTFDASCSSADEYHWYFGDGDESRDPLTKHTFLAPGKYSVSLTVTKDGQRDNIFGYIEIKNTGKETSCLPAYVRGLSIWPSPEADSVVFLYDGEKKIDQVQWFVNKATVYTTAAKFGYDDQDRIQTVSFSGSGGSRTASIAYDANSLPTGMQITNTVNAEFTHDLDWKLTGIKYTKPSDPDSHTTSYEYDPYGNTVSVSYSGSNVVNGGKGRDNTAFHSALTFYSASKELKFFFEYVIGIEPYVNSLKWSTVFENRGGPGWEFDYKSYTDPDQNNPPGLDREYAVTVDPNTNLPVRLSPNTGDVVRTDLTYSKVVYTCNP